MSVENSQRAVFFDRDGTLCADADYLGRWEDFHEFPEIGTLSRLVKQGFMLIGVTNQSGIARGIIKEQFVKDVNNHFIERHGFTDFYYCPHHPDEHCSCRKPEPGMALAAQKEHGLDLGRSYVVGDTDRDMLLARAVGAKAVLVQTGKQRESAHADFVARNLEETVRFILDDI